MKKLCLKVKLECLLFKTFFSDKKFCETSNESWATENFARRKETRVENNLFEKTLLLN